MKHIFKIDQLDHYSLAEHYDGKPTGATVYHVMLKPSQEQAPSGVLGRGVDLDSAIADFHYRYNIENK